MKTTVNMESHAANVECGATCGLAQFPSTSGKWRVLPFKGFDLKILSSTNRL